jgi:hypothetical protein
MILQCFFILDGTFSRVDLPETTRPTDMYLIERPIDLPFEGLHKAPKIKADVDPLALSELLAWQLDEEGLFLGFACGVREHYPPFGLNQLGLYFGVVADDEFNTEPHR